jgi:hypothetical protein
MAVELDRFCPPLAREREGRTGAMRSASASRASAAAEPERPAARGERGGVHRAGLGDRWFRSSPGRVSAPMLGAVAASVVYDHGE